MDTKVIAVLSFCLFSSMAICQDAAYIYQGDSIPLFVDRTKVIFMFKPSAAPKNDSATFVNDNSIVHRNVSDGNEDTLYAMISYDGEQEDLTEVMSRYSLTFTTDLEGISYSYTDRIGNKMAPTNEVLFKLNQGFSYQDIASAFSHIDSITLFTDNQGFSNFRISPMDSVFDIATRLWHSGKVEFAEPNFHMAGGNTQQDPLFGEQYYLHNTGQVIDNTPGQVDVDIDAPQAWELSTGQPLMRVGILDDGIDTSPDHEDLPVIGGFTPNCLFNCDGRPRERGCHGQAVAGIVGATHNSLGIRGISPNCTVIPFRIYKLRKKSCPFDDNCICELKSNWDIYTAIKKSWDDFNCDVLNNSWQTPNPSGIITLGFQGAMSLGRSNLGTVVVAATGNGGTNDVVYPADIPGMIAVGAVSKFGTLSTYSNTGPEVDVVAPSGATTGTGDVRTTDRETFGYEINDKYTDNFNGTSAAAPQVAAIAALLLSRDATLTRDEVECRIQNSAIDMGVFGQDDDFGFGRANAYFTIAFDNMTIDKSFAGEQHLSASNTITLTNNIILPGSNVEYIAGNKIVATAGSSALFGSNFHARIDNTGPCGAGPFKTASGTSGNSSFDNHSTITDKPKTTRREWDGFRLYPNPTSGRFDLVFGKQLLSKIFIYDIVGNLVYSSMTEGAYSQTIDISNHGKGVYIVRVTQGENTYTQKLVHQ